MKLSEIFYSIQGESTYVGLPCVFIRTSGCNLNCTYCDTRYASVPQHSLTPVQIVDKIQVFPHTHLVEITGGEPLLQPDIYELFDLLHRKDFTILLETNGSIDLSTVPDYVCKVIDIKTPSSGAGDSFLLSNLNYFAPTKDNIKIVLGDLHDYMWMKDFLTENNLFGDNILVSTVFTEIPPHIIVEQILSDGLDVRFQLQLHKYIWDVDRRGV